MHPSSKVKAAPFDDAKFNDAFRSLVRKYQTDESGFGELGTNGSREVFAFFGLKDGTSDFKFSLTNLRVLMLLNLLAKFQKRKITVYVTDAALKESLRETCRLFAYEKSIHVELFSTDIDALRTKLDSIDESFRIADQNGADVEVSIDLVKIMKHFNLKNYDPNLKLLSVDETCQTKTTKFGSSLLASFGLFLDSLPQTGSSKILNVCSNSELFQRQKADVVARPLHPSLFKPDDQEARVKYLSSGQVQLKTDSVLGDDVGANYAKRESYFREISKQRNLISSELTEENITNLTRFSFAYDLFSTNYQTPVKNFNQDFEVDEELTDEDDDDEDDERMTKMCKENKSASFILYNCARINAILEKFDRLRKQGAYPREMADFETLDFAKLLKSDFERKLCSNYLFTYESLVDGLKESVFGAEGALVAKLNLDKHLRHLNDMIYLFSKYYSKVHVLEDPKFAHLHEQMNARIYLLKLIISVSKSVLGLFNVRVIKRI